MKLGMYKCLYCTLTAIWRGKGGGRNLYNGLPGPDGERVQKGGPSNRYEAPRL